MIFSCGHQKEKKNLEELSDNESIEETIKNLKLRTSNNKDINYLDIQSNLKLEKLGINNSVITWNSSHPSIINENGLLNFDKKREKDVKITLTATVSKGKEKKDLNIIVVVKKTSKSNSKNDPKPKVKPKSDPKPKVKPKVKSKNDPNLAKKKVTIFDFFKSDKSESELKDERFDFINNHYFVLQDMNPPNRIYTENDTLPADKRHHVWLINSEISPSKAFSDIFAPKLHKYNPRGETTKLSVKFPDCFKHKLKEEIKQVIRDYKVEEIDIFFTIERALGAGLQLKAHYWIPGRIDLVRDWDVHTTYNKIHPIGIFSPNYNIDAPSTFREDVMTQFNVHIHPTLGASSNLSGNTGFIGMPANIPTNRPVALWSLVIAPEVKRAAISLHWLLVEDSFDHDLSNISEVLSTYFTRNESISLNKLVQEIERLPLPNRFMKRPPVTEPQYTALDLLKEFIRN